MCVSALSHTHTHVHPRKRLPRAESRADTLHVALPYSSSRRQDSSGISKRRRRLATSLFPAIVVIVVVIPFSSSKRSAGLVRGRSSLTVVRPRFSVTVSSVIVGRIEEKSRETRERQEARKKRNVRLFREGSSPGEIIEERCYLS